MGKVFTQQLVNQRQHRKSDILVIEKRLVRIKDEQEIETDIILPNNVKTRVMEKPITNIFPAVRPTPAGRPTNLDNPFSLN
ncbi:MAG: hypothetical protein WHS77_03735 [Brevinematales bacterium]